MPLEPPPKKEQLQKLLERGNVFVHLDPRVEGVVVPSGHAHKPQLVLQLGLHFAVPIPDLKIDDRGVRCTLSFNRTPFLCVLPWSAVYAMVAEDGQVTVWPTELPPELVPQPATVRRTAPTSRASRSREVDPPTGSSDTPSVPAAPARPRIAAVPALKAEPVQATSEPPAEQPEAPAADAPPASPSSRPPPRERPAWLRVVK
jgi:stringent starvation protein B